MEKNFTDNNINCGRGYTFILSSPYIMTGKEYYDRYTSRARSSRADQSYGVPEKIQKMLSLYEYGDGSFQKKCEVFLRQGIFMQDYEDDAMWYGDLRRFFPVYHDLNVRQLRGYFAWRTEVRKGRFKRTCETFAYIYIYELLNGIGTGSFEESFEKLSEFYREYVEAGLSDPSIRKDLRRWLMEFAITHGMPKEKALRFADPDAEKRAHMTAVLKDPGSFTDEEVFEALRYFSPPKASTSPVISKYPEKGKHIFAEVWRHLASRVFTRCFGELHEEPWHPLAGAVYCDRPRTGNMEYDLDECRRYVCRDGEWKELRYSIFSQDREAFLLLMHMTDLRLRRMLKTGGYLKKKQGEEQAEELVDQALEEIRKEAALAARPKVNIDLSGLDRIRRDAGETCESLLTEEEIDEDLPSASMAKGVEASPDATSSTGLDDIQTAVLMALLKETGDESFLISENHLMPQVVADSINEAFFDDIGDSVIECDNDKLSLVEDYIEDVSRIVEA